MRTVAALLLSVSVLVWTAAAYAHDDHRHPVTARVTVQHVTRGCHELVLGSRHGAGLQLTVARDRAVGVVNADGDTFRIVQASGPKVATGGRLITGLMGVLMLERPGRYVFDVVRVAKGSYSAHTVGADNRLRLTIHVH